MKALLQLIAAIVCDGITAVALLSFFHTAFSHALPPCLWTDCLVILAAFATVVGGFYFWPSAGYEARKNKEDNEE